jgi:formate hydrogenlyase subunit 3/multisubunit Na+/H+ antiporter MnhD subunit
MMLEAKIALLSIAYTIISYLAYSTAKKERDSLVTVFTAIMAVALGYISLEARGVSGLLGFIGSATLLTSLALGEISKVERRSLFSMFSFYFTASSIMLTATTNAVRMFIYWETIAMLMIGGMVIYKKDESYEAALKYAVICIPGSIIGLIGLILAIFSSGTISFPYMLNNSGVLSIMLMAIGFGTEVALFPMYVWLPSLYIGMPPLLLAVEIASILPATTYIVGTIASMNYTVAIVTASLALIGSIVGSLSAMTQNDLRKLLSYSTLSHIGYMLLGLSVGTALARDYSVLHMVAHAIPKASLVAVTFALLSKLGNSGIEGLRKFGNSYKLVIMGSALALLGLPPFLSFWSELYIFLGAFASTLPWKLLALVYFAVILISTGYAFKIIYSYSSEDKGGEYGTDTFAIILLLFFLLSLSLSPFQSYLVTYFLGPL